MNLSVLYRGPLTSCNYDCAYCPFAKRTESKARLAEDRAGLTRLEEWLARESAHRWRILFTPWGEALVRPWYRAALARLSQQRHVDTVAAQTNLSCPLDWLADCEPSRLALWATYHPSEVDQARFVRKVLRVREQRVRVSVGAVGVPESWDALAALRRELPADVYFWINPQQPRTRPYTPADVARFESLDPYFALSRPRRTLGLACRAGEASFTVDGAGDIRRCHFVDEAIGNIGQPEWEQTLKRRPCPNASCRCYLGLAQFEPSGLARVFGPGLLERIPLHFAAG